MVNKARQRVSMRAAQATVAWLIEGGAGAGTNAELCGAVQMQEHIMRLVDPTG